jgi:hypothetical protein
MKTDGHLSRLGITALTVRHCELMLPAAIHDLVQLHSRILK